MSQYIQLPTDHILNNRYRIIKYIDRGGMGAIYKAEDLKFDKSIRVIKELIPISFTPEEKKRAEELFKKEAYILNELRHSNIPRVIDYFINNGRYYLAMDFIDGENLKTILEGKGKNALSQDEVIDWIKQILDVLDYIHTQNIPIIYRDIKPENIMLDKEGRAMLIDFGIAKRLQQTSASHTPIGTPGYAPPEQHKGDIKPQSDIYSIGATMHHLLTGKSPSGFKFESIIKFNPTVSSDVEKIVMRALEFKLEDRFSSAKEMKEALDKLPFSKSQTPKGTVTQPKKITSKPLQNIPKKRTAKKSTILIHLLILLISIILLISCIGVYSLAHYLLKTSSSTPTPKAILYNYIKPEMVIIKGGSFYMGSIRIDEDRDRDRDEGPVHKVKIDSFYIGKYEVTNKEYCLYDPNHSNPGDNLPVVEVSWDDAVAYCKWLSNKQGLEICYTKTGEGTYDENVILDITKNGYRLPTEAEWEYACRAGSTTTYYWGNEMNGDYCWYAENSTLGDSGRNIHPIGQKLPNIWGLYDMIGNAGEWCSDWYNEYYYSDSPSNNPICNAPRKSWNGSRVHRGGSSYAFPAYCRSASRESGSSWRGNIGFRLVRTYQNKNTVPYPTSVPYPTPKMVLIPEGIFNMGSYNERYDQDTRPVHKIKVKSFYMGKYEITNKEFCSFLNSQGNRGVITTHRAQDINDIGDTEYSAIHKESTNGTFIVKTKYEKCAVIYVSWYGAIAYCNWLSKQHSLEPCYDSEYNLDIDKKGYRLPTEAEWEYACRGGTDTDFFWGENYSVNDFTPKKSRDYVWYLGFGREKPPPEVGEKLPNPFGLYDINGNLSEWCNDNYCYNYYQYCIDNNINTNPLCLLTDKKEKVIRGGNHVTNAEDCSSASRDSSEPENHSFIIGFRLVKTY